jgi:hypothetical protein
MRKRPSVNPGVNSKTLCKKYNGESQASIGTRIDTASKDPSPNEDRDATPVDPVPVTPVKPHGVTAGERIQMALLRGEFKKAKETVDILFRANQEISKKLEEPAPHCNPAIVKRIANSVVSNLILEKEMLFPSEDIQQAALLTEFGMTVDTSDPKYLGFQQAWSLPSLRPNFRGILKDALRRRKGTLTKVQ